MDNLQQHYLQRFETVRTIGCLHNQYANPAYACELALHGDIEMCVNICLELRLQPDLAFWTRAMVNLTLAAHTTLDKHPDKAKFADEALRLATELQESAGEDRTALWMVEYKRVEEEARKLRAELSVEAMAQGPDVAEVEGGMEGLVLGSPGKEAYTEIFIEDDETNFAEPWTLEGAFTPGYAMSRAKSSKGSRGSSSGLPPSLATKTETDASQLPSPPPTDQPQEGNGHRD